MLGFILLVRDYEFECLSNLSLYSNSRGFTPIRHGGNSDDLVSRATERFSRSGDKTVK